MSGNAMAGIAQYRAPSPIQRTSDFSSPLLTNSSGQRKNGPTRGRRPRSSKQRQKAQPLSDQSREAPWAPTSNPSDTFHFHRLVDPIRVIVQHLVKLVIRNHQIAFRCGFCALRRRYCPIFSATATATGTAAATSPSSLSRKPPWPGMRLLESFTSNTRFTHDSKKSPA